MSIRIEKLIKRAQDGQRESKNLDFKRGFDLSSKAEWCEIIKDIVAFANSGGGALVLGANDDGSPADVDIAPYLKVDPADITNKISAYTGYDFSEFEILEISRNGQPLALYAIYESPIPMVFTRHGADIGKGKAQRSTFVKGSVYFRHGAKSEPGTSADLKHWLDRSLDSIRDKWLGGIRQVVEADPEQQVRVVTLNYESGSDIVARIEDTPDAVPVRPQNPEKIWPYREGQLIQRMLSELPEGVPFNGHDVRCIKIFCNINPESYPNFVFKPHKTASPQYSEGFAKWILRRYRGSINFFSEMRDLFRNKNKFKK